MPSFSLSLPFCTEGWASSLSGSGHVWMCSSFVPPSSLLLFHRWLCDLVLWFCHCTSFFFTFVVLLFFHPFIYTESWDSSSCSSENSRFFLSEWLQWGPFIASRRILFESALELYFSIICSVSHLILLISFHTIFFTTFIVFIFILFCVCVFLIHLSILLSAIKITLIISFFFFCFVVFFCCHCYIFSFVF